MFPWKEKLIVAIVSTVALLTALTIIVAIVWRDAQKHSAEVLGLRQELQNRSSAVNALPMLRDDAQKAAPYKDLLNRLFSSPEALNQFSQNIELLAKKYKVTAAINYPKTDSPFAVVITGDLSATQKFLDELKNGLYAITFPAADIVKTGTKYKTTAYLQLYENN